MGQSCVSFQIEFSVHNRAYEKPLQKDKKYARQNLILLKRRFELFKESEKD